MNNTILSIKAVDSFESYFTEIKTLLEVSDDNYEYYYRGCSSHDWGYNLVPGIYRHNLVAKEDNFFKEMILRSPNDFIDDATTLEKLVKMQHYRLPTRLLDITSNPLVALYFACLTYKDEKKNGKVYVFKIKKDTIKYYDSDALCLIANLAKLNMAKTNFEEEGFGYLMHEIRDEKPQYSGEFGDKNKAHITTVFPVKVKLNNNRIVRQSGAFFIFGMKDISTKEKSAELAPDIICREIAIDEREKQSILSVLNLFAINRYTLFPELENAAQYLDNR